MRVEFWPSIINEPAQVFFAFDLSPDTVDLLLENNQKLVSQFSRRDDTFSNGLRYRIRSPILFLTVCQGRQKKIRELAQLVKILTGNVDDLQWEIRVPTDDWAIEAKETAELTLDDINVGLEMSKEEISV